MLVLNKNGNPVGGIGPIAEGSAFFHAEGKVGGTSAFDGWSLNDGENEWTLTEVPPTPPTPEQLRSAMPTLSPVQFRKMLRGQGITATMVEAAIAAIPDAEGRADASDAWEYATFFERLNPLIDGIGTALDLPPEDIDTIWQGYAATL